MAYEIVLAPEAVEDLRALGANVRAAVRRALETHLRHEPAKTSRSRIKRLRGVRRPQFRLRSAKHGCSMISLARRSKSLRS
jgi:mRNA interferase RelE/StbE